MLVLKITRSELLFSWEMLKIEEQIHFETKSSSWRKYIFILKLKVQMPVDFNFETTFSSFSKIEIYFYVESKFKL